MDRLRLAADQRRLRIIGAAAFIVLVTFAAYLPAIEGEFLWDDDRHVSENGALRNLEGLKLIWTRLGATPQYYPLTHTSFWIEYQIWGANPKPFHITNVLLHIASALILWRILAMLDVRAAWFAACLFAAHPIEVESVAWISERKNVLSGFFYLCAMWTYLSASGVTVGAPLRVTPAWKGYIGAMLFFAAAVLSKTVTGTLPAAILLIVWWKARRIISRHVLWLLPMFIIAIAMGSLTAWMEREYVGAVGPEWEFSLVQRLIIAGMSVWFYASKIVLPYKLMFIYPKFDVNPPLLWQWIFPVTAALTIVVLFALRNRIGRGPLVAVLFFVGTLFPALGFSNIYPMRYSFVADHFQYLAGIGIIVLVAEILARGLDRLRVPRRWMILLPIVLAMLTFKQSQMYANPQALWQTTLERNPRAWIAHDQLGALATSSDEAAGHYLRAIELEPKHIEGYLGLGALFEKLGRPLDAAEQYRRAIAVRPDKPAPHYWLGGALVSAEDLEAALSAYQQALRLDPKFIFARQRLVELYTKLGRSDDARRERLELQRQTRELLGR